MKLRRAILIVLDSVGIGEAPDADDYGDVGSATLQHTASAVGGLSLPVMESMGLGNIPGLINRPPIAGVRPVEHPSALFAAMQEKSEGKDTITGHWEIAGLDLNPGFHLFPAENSFPPELLATLSRETGHPLLGNKAASGTAILNELGEQSLRETALIVYTSADSVLQIAAHVDAIPLSELYRACEIGRRLCDPLRVGRVIARPFSGTPDAFIRTQDRRDFAYQTNEPTILQRIQEAGITTYAVGKIEDIFAGRGIDRSVHTGDNLSSQAQVLTDLETLEHGLIFANFIDFDMLYGHRRDPTGYARALEQTDHYLGQLIAGLHENDLLLITADHGNDPTFPGTDHTREFVPLLAYRKGLPGGSAACRQGYYDIAQTLSDFFELPPHVRGTSFLRPI